MSFGSLLATVGVLAVALCASFVVPARNRLERRISRALWVVGLAGLLLFAVGVSLMHRA